MLQKKKMVIIKIELVLFHVFVSVEFPFEVGSVILLESFCLIKVAKLLNIVLRSEGSIFLISIQNMNQSPESNLEYKKCTSMVEANLNLVFKK